MCFEHTKVQLESWAKWLHHGCGLGLGICAQLDFSVRGGGEIMPDEEASVIDRTVAMLKAENPYQGEIVFDYHVRGRNFREIANDRRRGVATIKAEYDKGVAFVDGRKITFKKAC